MEPEQQMLQEPLKNRLFMVTPLSKHLALALFVALPFIGGWVGYIYAPVKVVEKTIVVEKNNSDMEVSSEVVQPITTNVLMSDEALFQKLGYKFIFQKKMSDIFGTYTPLIAYINNDDALTVLYQYDRTSKSYQILVNDVSSLIEQPVPQGLFLELLSSVNTDHLAYLRYNAMEGGVRSPLFIFDTYQPELGFQDLGIIVSNSRDSISPDKTWIVGQRAGNENELVAFSFVTGEIVSVFTAIENESLVSTTECYGACIPSFEWTDDNHLKITIFTPDESSEYGHEVDEKILTI